MDNQNDMSRKPVPTHKWIITEFFLKVHQIKHARIRILPLAFSIFFLWGSEFLGCLARGDEIPIHNAKPFNEKQNFLENWEEGLRRYNYRVLFDMVSSEFQRETPEFSYLKSKRDQFLATSNYRSLKPGDDYRETILAFLETDLALNTIPREKVIKSLDWFLKTYLPFGEATLAEINQTSGETSKHGNPESKISFDLSSALQHNYSPEVSAIDRLEPHSFHDLDGYLGFQTGPELESFYLDKRLTMGFFMTDEPETCSILKALGYPKLFRVNASGFNRRMRTIIGYNSLSDRVCIAQFAFYSDEQLLNHQARFYFLRRKLFQGAGESVFVLRRRDPAFPQQEEFKRFLKSLNEPVTCFFAGFTNQLKKILGDFRLVNLGDLSLIVGHLPGKDARKGKLVIGLSGFGASYGSLPGKIAAIIEPFGLKNVVYVGTGGGITKVKNRFDWAIPDSAFLADSNLSCDFKPISFDNRALGLSLKKNTFSGLHATVQTPLAETGSFASKLAKLKVISVDCELYHLAKFLSFCKSSISFYALINITDFPKGKDEDKASEKSGEISVENSKEQYEAVENAIEEIAKHLSQ